MCIYVCIQIYIHTNKCIMYEFLYTLMYAYKKNVIESPKSELFRVLIWSPFRCISMPDDYVYLYKLRTKSLKKKRIS
jgi:hypothetical protein